MTTALLAGNGPLAESLNQLLAQRLGRELRTDVDSAAPGNPEVVVVHMPSLGDGDAPPAPDEAARIIASATRVAIKRIVVVSSALVHPPQPSHPGLVEQRSPAFSGTAPISRRWRELERVVEGEAGKAGLEAAILRPAPTLVPGEQSFFAQLLSGTSATMFRGHDPGVQFLDPVDLVEAVALLVEADEASGIFHAAPASVIPLSRALELAGIRAKQILRLPPSPAAEPTAAGDLRERLRYEWTVGSDRLAEATGYTAQHSSAAAILRFRGEEPSDGAQAYDSYGLAPDEVDRLDRGILGFLHDRWWRVETSGMQHIPADGAAIMVGIHRGFMPFDGAMTVLDVKRSTGRELRVLLHPSLVKFPYLAPFHTQLGGVIATVRNAEKLLERGGLVGIYPEGIDGAFMEFREAYNRLAPFGRDQFARLAIARQVPIVPFVTVGPVEAYPVLKGIDWGWWKRLTGWPSFPITATWPFIPMPLPTKWHTRVLPPIDVGASYPTEAARDAAAVSELSARLQETLMSGWRELRRQRGDKIFAGAIRHTDAT